MPLKKIMHVSCLAFSNQLMFFKLVFSKSIRVLKLYLRSVQLDILKVQSSLQRLKLKYQYAKKSTVLDDSKIKITFYAAVRKVNNHNFDLERSLQTIVANCHDPRHVELLLAIDQDDDIAYFTRLKNLYGKIFKFQLLISSVRHGYQKLHLYDKELFPLAMPTTRMLCDFSDDCSITMKNFDIELLKIDALYPDNIYFIHTRETQRDAYLGDVSQNMFLLFWIMQAREPGSFFPIISKKVLDIAHKFASTHDKNQEWSPIANAWICDCYVDILANYVKKFGLDRIHHMDLIYMTPHSEISLGSHQRSLNEYGLSPNNLAFIKMLSHETLDYLQNLSKTIVECAHDAKVDP